MDLLSTKCFREEVERSLTAVLDLTSMMSDASLPTGLRMSTRANPPLCTKPASNSGFLSVWLYWYQEAVAVYGSEPFELISHDWPSQSGEVANALEHWRRQNETASNAT